MNSVKVSVLGYIEDGDWVAHALEMDVIGVGDTWKEALEELDGNVQAHISFAKFKKDNSLIFQLLQSNITIVLAYQLLSYPS